MTDLLLSIDLGTTRLKVAAFSPEGTLHHQLSRRHREHADGPRRWQSADEWWQDTTELLKALLEQLHDKLGHSTVLGLSLSGRGGAAVFADADGRVLAQPWSDGRHRQQQRALREAAAPAALSPYAGALLAKILWLRQAEPALARRVRRVFYGKDLLLYRLTGDHATDYSSGPDGPAWNQAALDALDVDLELLPEPRLPWALTSGLSPAAAGELGLPAGTPVAVGAHDGVCANIGAGAARSGNFALTLGTHAVVRAVVAAPPPEANRFYCLPPAAHVIGANAWLGGRAADWFLDLTGSAEPPGDEARARLFEALDAAAAELPVGAGGAVFLPYLGGELAAVAHPSATGVFAGLTADHERAHLHRAVLEGVSLAVAENFERVSSWCGRPASVRLTGSGARSPLWGEMLAAALNVPLEVSDAAVEGRGAAICLAVALGAHANVQRAGDRMVPIVRRIEPDPALVSAYGTLRQSWADLAARLSGWAPPSPEAVRRPG